MTDTESVEKLKRAKASRKAHVAIITRKQATFEQIAGKTTLELTDEDRNTAETLLASLSDKNKVVDSLNLEILDLTENTDDQMEAEIVHQDEIDMKLNSLTRKIESWLSANFTVQESPPEDSLSSVSSHREKNIRLPRIELPTFDGAYKDWVPFYDMFKGTVDNHASLPAVQKLYYLKGALRGEAKNLLAHLPTTDANYSVALNLLQGRYENQSMITKAHLTNIFKIGAVKPDHPESLRKLLNSFTENEMALKALGLGSTECDFLWIHILSEKLDTVSAREWQLSNKDGKVKTLQEFRQFLDQRATALEAVQKLQSTSVSPKERPKETSNGQSYATTSKECPVCKQSHRIYLCPKFTSSEVSVRRETAKELRLCFNCLRHGHAIRNCSSKTVCRTCGQKHHTLLHDSSLKIPRRSDTSEFAGHQKDTTKHTPCTMLSTAMVSIKDSFGKLVSCRALLDSGSQMSFITHTMVEKLKLNKERTQLSLSGVGGITTNKYTSRTTLDLATDQGTIEVKAYVLKTITGCIPSRPLDISRLPSLKQYYLADPNFNTSASVDLLLGADIFEKLIMNQREEITPGLFLRKTIFGWVFVGQQESQTSTVVVNCHLSLEESVRKFWEIENFPSQTFQTKEEIECEVHFQETTRIENDRFVVKLPFKKHSSLGESLPQAKRRFESLERRLDQNPELKERYTSFIDEFLCLKHMEEVPENEIVKSSSEVYYLPHHCVLKESSKTTNFRVVFDDSAKTSNGCSLNDNLLVGPVVQDNLIAILTRFRFNVVALSADIAKMYRQVVLDNPEKDFHRILWRESKDGPLRHLRMKRVTYGIASSAFHSTRCLKEIANRTENSIVRDCLNRCFYVDDFLGGAPTIDEAKSLLDNLVKELRRYGFDLRKWASSHTELISELPVEMRENADSLELFSEEYRIKALGISWHPNTDMFFFQCRSGGNHGTNKTSSFVRLVKNIRSYGLGIACNHSFQKSCSAHMGARFVMG